MTVNGREAEAVLILAIDKVHVDRIFDGHKKFELRKQLPRASFQRVYLYQTGGAGVVGCFDVTSVITATVEELWEQVGDSATPYERFFRYFNSFKRGHAIGIANPVRFSLPVGLTALRTVGRSITAPRSFVRLPTDQPVAALLESVRLDELDHPVAAVSLEPIREVDKDLYRKLVLQHIGPNYEDIDATFADSIIRTHEAGVDSIGFFTQAKHIHRIVAADGKLHGFTTTTLKGGGSVKTGPTILLPDHQGHGVGQQTRIAIDRWARSQGARKVYCTAPASSPSVIKYLLSSGHRVEAHLRRHYASDHDELVFGKMLVPHGTVVKVNTPTQSIPSRAVAVSEVTARRRLRTDLQRVLRYAWFPLERHVADRIIMQLLEDEELPYEMKPRRMIALQAGKRFVGATILLPKRGGSVKGLLVTETAHTPSLSRLIDRAEACARDLSATKLFYLHPVDDGRIVSLLREHEFTIEGVLEEPYAPGQDLCVLSKSV
jgi:predicted transcriptional regulator/GNAT superfamily N-acetyltransferase